MNSAGLEKSIRKEIDHGLALPLTIKYLQNIKNQGVVHVGVAEKLSINEKEERYIKIYGIITTMLLWRLPDQDTTYDLRNAKEMANKRDLYWKDRPGRSLPPEPCKYHNRVDLYLNCIQASFSLPAVTL